MSGDLGIAEAFRLLLGVALAGSRLAGTLTSAAANEHGRLLGNADASRRLRCPVSTPDQFDLSRGTNTAIPSQCANRHMRGAVDLESTGPDKSCQGRSGTALLLVSVEVVHPGPGPHIAATWLGLSQE
jgi:hypothetical protein